MRLFVVLFLALFQTSYALLLEDIKDKENFFKDKTVGYMTGSFDPLHKGHEQLALDPIDEGFCDYVIMFPLWGGDSHKKRTDIRVRQDMLIDQFQPHPHIIVTRLDPGQLQMALTTSTKPKFKGLKFVGIMGSDSALFFHDHQDYLTGFMTGSPIPDHYAQNTYGSLMALPVDAFIVKLRGNDRIDHLKGKLGNRPILHVIEINSQNHTSSSAVKHKLQEGQGIDQDVQKSVIQSIENHRLYADAP